MRLPLPCPCGYECSVDLSGATIGTGEWKRERPEALKGLGLINGYPLKGLSTLGI